MVELKPPISAELSTDKRFGLECFQFSSCNIILAGISLVKKSSSTSPKLGSEKQYVGGKSLIRLYNLSICDCMIIHTYITLLASLGRTVVSRGRG